MRSKFNDLELRRLVNYTRVETPDFVAGMSSLTQWLLATLSGVKLCALIIGEAGTGKTELLRSFVFRHASKRDQNGLNNKVVLVNIPTSPTAIAILQAILEALGDPRPAKGSRKDKMRRVVKALKDQSVMMLLLDDVQHCLDKNSGLVIYDASECLKELTNESSVSIIGAGLEDSKKVIKSNEQSKRRHLGSVYLRRFDWADAESQNSFVALLRAFEERLEMFELPALSSARFSLRMYLASGGLIDFVAKVLSQVVWDALDRKSRTIRLCDFETGWLKALFDAENLGDNPFRASFNLSTNLEEKIRIAKLINEHVVPPVSKRNAKASAMLAAVGM